VIVKMDILIMVPKLVNNVLPNVKDVKLPLIIVLNVTMVLITFYQAAHAHLTLP